MRKKGSFPVAWPYGDMGITVSSPSRCLFTMKQQGSREEAITPSEAHPNVLRAFWYASAAKDSKTKTF